MGGKRYRPEKKVYIRELTKRCIVAGLVLGCVLVLFFAAFMILKSVGKRSFADHGKQVAKNSLSTDLGDAPEENEERELEEGQILAGGQVYAYNGDLLTFLCMGVDSRKGIGDLRTPGTAGQADALLLVVVDPKKEQIHVIAINRDTMTPIEIYDTAGMYLEKETAQIALQYAYGDGREKSCRLMEQVVSKLFYGIPIHGYAALDMEAIALLNDAVGGVDVTIPEDMTKFKAGWTKGSRVHLTGQDALLYVQRRDTAYLGTNLGRVERQKQYLTAYVKEMKEKLKEDMTFPLTLCGQVSEHMVTSLTTTQITYLADLLAGYEFSMENILSIPGESKMGEKHEEFYIEESALKDLVIRVFYEKAEP